jgi:hypothetical protein
MKFLFTFLASDMLKEDIAPVKTSMLHLDKPTLGGI